VVVADPASAAQAASVEIASTVRAAVAARGRCTLALSGGETPWLMLADLATAALPWDSLHVLQVDERIAPAGSPVRNLTRIQQLLVTDGPLPPSNLHAMPVEDANPDAAAPRYAAELARIAGDPPCLDLVHLGLGTDGHTASLVPGDPLLDAVGSSVGVSIAYRGHRRLTLTLPVLNRARRILWLVCGADKAGRLRELVQGGGTFPAARVAARNALVVADAAAAAHLQSPTSAPP
jgi:6-phosphogluconolactonase